VNPGSAVLGDPDVRQALALAIDRPALSRYWGLPTDEVMPLHMPGLIDEDRMPLDGPRVDDAAALLAGRTPELAIVWPTPPWCPECQALADLLADQLQAVGFVPRFIYADDPVLYANYRDTGYDLVGSFVWAEAPDPAWWMERFLTESQTSGGSNGAGFPADWVPDDIAAERDRLAELEGRERYDAAHALADRVATELMAIPIIDSTNPQLISDRVGCQRFRAGIYWLDLVAACPP
jgi:ABC-type oligopeptide transport system substrate-binding subunit